MSRCRLTVRAPEGAWQAEVSDWTGLMVLASLSAEPESLSELGEAVRRYMPEHDLFDRPAQTVGPEAVVNGPWCVIDLVGRTVVADVWSELPGHRHAYKADAEDQAEGFPIVWMDTPADWLFRWPQDDWQEVMAARAAARAAVVRIDARPVLFGRPMLEHLAQGVLAAVANGPSEGDRERELTRAIHSEWLMTPRADLGGRTPREVLLADRERISRDLEHRSDQWGRQGHAALPLSPTSTAYRLGGFGMMEVVLYFDLVRVLLAEAWKLKSGVTQSALVERLSDVRDGWLRVPYEGSDSALAPAVLIESERRRLPISSDDCPLDPDCPICQAMEGGEFGPAFMWFDGHHLELEDEFAFSLCATREEWEREQEDHRRFAEEMDRKERERAAQAPDADPLAGSAWQSSFVDWDVFAGPGASPEQALMALSFPLAELVSNLQGRPDGVEPVRALNRAYGAVRASQDEVARGSAAQELRELLEEVGRKFPELTARCADLQSRVDEVLRRCS